MLPGAPAVHVNGASYGMLGDARMNLLAITDNAGAVLHRYRYEPFGVPSSTTSPTTTGLEPLFDGMRYPKDAGLYLAGMRLMDPKHGFWLSHDPMGYVDSPNLYAYAGQNPIDFIDPVGDSLSKGAASLSNDGMLTR